MSDKKSFYIPSLDGFRAIAVFIVFASHAGYSTFPGGFGVTIFFFLSGYLITTLLRLEYEKYGEISLKNFYLRRAYRILPPMYFVLVFIVILCITGVLASKPSLPGLMAQIFHVTNYYIIYKGYDGIPPSTGVFWSLAVEEHFYLVFSVSLVLLLKRFGYRKICCILLLTCVIVLLWRIFLVYSWHVSELRTYFGTDTRIDNLLFGCVMGLFANPVLDPVPVVFRGFTRQLGLGLLSLLGLLFSLTFRNADFRETFRYTVQGIAFIPIFWLAIRYSHSVLFRPLNWRWVKGLGIISYPFYLTHFFWIFVSQHIFPSSRAVSTLLALIATLMFATAIHFYIEKPFARLRTRLHTHSTSQPKTRGNSAATEY